MEWVGPSSETYKEVVNKKLDKVSKISGLYNVFGKFMKSTSSGFTDVNKNISEGFENLNSEAKICPRCGSMLINGICSNCNSKVI